MILSPIIEKHITELTREQKNFLAGRKSEEAAPTSPKTLAADSASDATSQQTIRHQRSDATPRGPRRSIAWLNYLVIIVEISQQVLRLNSRKYNFVVKGNMETQISSINRGSSEKKSEETMLSPQL